MDWYVVCTKARQEARALENLERQGYVCYLPTLRVQKLRRGKLSFAQEALFSRYLFVQLDKASTAKSWAPIRSTRGVSGLLMFGNEYTQVHAGFVETLQQQQTQHQPEAKPLFQPGQTVKITDGAFKNVEVIYQQLLQLPNGEMRALVLIELLNKRTALQVPVGVLQK